MMISNLTLAISQTLNFSLLETNLLNNNPFKAIFDHLNEDNNSFLFFNYRKTIFDHPNEDPNYNPLPEEERPGGFEWNEGDRPAPAAEATRR